MSNTAEPGFSAECFLAVRLNCSVIVTSYSQGILGLHHHILSLWEVLDMGLSRAAKINDTLSWE